MSPEERPKPGRRPHHPVARVEEGVRGLVTPLLRGGGYGPRVVPYTGYGTDGWVRVLGRVLLSPPRPRRAAGSGENRGWRRFLSAPAAGVPVHVSVGDQITTVVTDRDGYLDVRIGARLSPGWAEAQLELADPRQRAERGPVTARLRIVGPDTRLGMVSDIDDTVIVTMLPRPLLAFRNAFLLPERDRRPVPGMADLYRAISAQHPDMFVVYLSTGAWNVAPALSRFLQRNGFPAGPMLLTDWGPTEQTLFRSGREHKRAQLRRLFEEFPQLSWLLVGDDGQHDPTLYAEAAREHPGKVEGIVLRELSLGEQVASHGMPHREEVTDDPGFPADGEVPTTVCGPDGYALHEQLRRRGLVLSQRDEDA